MEMGERKTQSLDLNLHLQLEADWEDTVVAAAACDGAADRNLLQEACDADAVVDLLANNRRILAE